MKPAMDYTRLGRTGLKVSRICLGCMTYLEDAAAALEIRLSEEERRELEEPYRPHSVLGHD
jgi:1-deoxyxylulose-5-phosphate synthase